MIRPFVPSDMEWVYLADYYAASSRRVFDGPMPDPSEFGSVLWRGVLSLMVCLDSREEPCGLVEVRFANFEHGHADLRLVSLGNDRRAFARATREFVDFVSGKWPLRQLYVEVEEGLESELLTGVRESLRQVGTLSKHRYRRGEYCDVHMYLLDLEEWRARPS